MRARRRRKLRRLVVPVAAGILVLGAVWIVGGPVMDRLGAPGAIRPCDDDFAVSLGHDPIFADLPATVALPPGTDSDGRGHCTDADDGGVSVAGNDYRTTLSSAEVMRFYRASATAKGWQGVTVTEPQRTYHLLCAHRAVQHKHVIYLDIDMMDLPGPGLPAGTRTFDVGIKGDPRTPPC